MAELAKFSAWGLPDAKGAVTLLGSGAARMKHASHPVLILALLASSATAQTTHLVGPGGFAQIRDALAVAAPGDIVNVQPGTYAHFDANVGVTIRALTIGSVLVEYDPAFASGCTPGVTCGPTRIAPPAGQVVNCIGIDFRPNFLAFSYAHQVVVTSGTATFDRCTLRAQSLPGLTVNAARVHLQGCTLAGVGTGAAAPGMAATNAVVTAVRTTFTGSSSASLPGVGVRLRGSELQGSRLQLTGGAQLFGGAGGAALDLDATSSAWISDSTLAGGGGTTCPIAVGGGTGRIDRSVLTPSGACASLPAGLVVGADSSTPLQNGGPFTVDWRTSPNQLVAIYASPGLGYLPLPGLTDQAVTIDLGSSWLATVLLSDATGFATVTWNMPPGLFIDTSVFVMAAGYTGTTFAVSPPVGGVIR